MAMGVKAALVAMESLSFAMEDMSEAIAGSNSGILPEMAFFLTYSNVQRQPLSKVPYQSVSADFSASLFADSQRSLGEKSAKIFLKGGAAKKNPLPKNLVHNPRSITPEIFRKHSSSEYVRAAAMHEHLAQQLQIHALHTGVDIDNKIESHKDKAAVFTRLAHLRKTRSERCKGIYEALGGPVGALNIAMLVISFPSFLAMVWQMLPSIFGWLARFGINESTLQHIFGLASTPH